jgi:hypothetical protein
MSAWQWKHRYETPLKQGGVINEEKPGRQIAKCISEIQAAIDNITGADGKGESIQESTEAALVDDSVEVTVVTGIRFANNQLQIKTQKINVTSAEDESGWTLMEGGQTVACDA